MTSLISHQKMKGSKEVQKQGLMTACPHPQKSFFLVFPDVMSLFCYPSKSCQIP